MPDRIQSRLAELVDAFRELSSVDDAIGFEERLCSFELPSPDDPYRSSRVAALDRLASPRAEAAADVAVAVDALRLALRVRLAGELAGTASPVTALLRSLQTERQEIEELIDELTHASPSDEDRALATVAMRWIREDLLVEAICRAEPGRAESFAAARRRRISQLAEDIGPTRFAERLRGAELEWLADTERLASGYPDGPAPDVWIDEPGEEVIARIDLPEEMLAAALAGDGGGTPMLPERALARDHRGRPASTAARVPLAGRPRFAAFSASRSTLIVAAALVTAIVIVGVVVTRGGEGGGATPAAGTTPSTTAGQLATSTTALVAPVVQTSTQAPATTVAITTVPTTVAATTSASTTAPSPSSAAMADAVTALARACPTLPSGSLAAAIRPNKAGTGTDPDPRTNQPTRWVGVGWASDLGAIEQRAPYSVTALLYLPGQTGATAGPPVDRQGAVQLWFSWDGTTRHKGIRRFDGTTWQMAVDADAADLTVAFPGTGLVFYWNGLQAGWNYAMLVATADGCQSSSTRRDGSPAPIT